MVRRILQRLRIVFLNQLLSWMLHGALLDAEILADVYLALTAGQGALDFFAPEADTSTDRAAAAQLSLGERPPLRVRFADAAELAAHEARLAAIDKASKGGCVWRRIEAVAAA